MGNCKRQVEALPLALHDPVMWAYHWFWHQFIFWKTGQDWHNSFVYFIKSKYPHGNPLHGGTPTWCWHASPESQFLWKLRVATGLWGRLLSDLTFAKFPLVLLHAQNLIRYHHLSSHHLHHPLRNALVFQTLKQPSLRHSFQAVSKLPKAHSPRQHPSTCHLCVVVPCMLLFSFPFWVILDDNVRWPIFVSKLETTTQIILSHTKISHFGWF